MSTKNKTKELRSVTDINRTIHEPTRFMIMAYLHVVESADFLFLQRQTGLTSGNLSSHLSKLEAAGYVKIEKEFLGKKPHTMLSLTKEGRAAFRKYRQSMKQVLNDLPNK
ncbi:MAG: winged helix-turn-helix domain-containing protein [Candidatus Methanofastidiosia archaeon]